MTVESASYISGLTPAYPPGSDSISEGDDHIRLIKSVLQGTFPNANAAMNGVHTGASAPTSTSAGQLWFDTTLNVLKIRNEADGAFVTLGASPVTDFKILGSNTVGWIPPTADGSPNQFLTTDGSGNLDWASASGDELPSQTGNSGKYLTTNGSSASWNNEIPSQTGNSGKFLTTDGSSASWAASSGSILATTHARLTGTAVVRSSVYEDTGLAFSHTKTVAASDLYINVNLFQNTYSNFATSNHDYVYVILTDSSDTLIVDTNNDQPIMIMDKGQMTGSGTTWDVGAGWSWMYKVTNANCPTPGAASQSFKMRTRCTHAGDMASDFSLGSTVMIWEIAT